ncbi:MAG: ABC transporter permease, partial [Bacteroidaceae bacterium]|nr:ABC transporter permease [Bacteroidaceae bacterium]
MSYINLFKVAIQAILSNKFRSFLSMLGIIIGVAAVIIMMAIGQGSKENVKAELSKMGTNLLTIRPGAERRFAGARPDPASMQTLKEEDVDAIRREATLITHISAEVSASGQIIYGNKNTTATLYGESPEYLDIKKWELKDGDCFTEEDCMKNSKVCVIGTTVVEQLFGSKDYNCVGKTIRFKNIPFRVVG